MSAKCITTKPAEILNAELRNFADNPKVEPLFVFPTEIQKNSWMDWVVNNEECGIGAVNKDQFIAWDQFKTQYVQPVAATKSMCIPPLLRKYFAQQILENQNFRKIINKEQAKESIYAFTDWLAKILPSLALWHKHYINDFKEMNKKEDDEETLDLLDLYNEYNKLLKDHDLYEPSYADINFSSGNRKIFLFYPVILQDFAEYYDALAESDDVTFVILPEAEPVKDGDYDKYCYCYPDSRRELRRLCLKIRQLAGQNKDFDLTRVAVNVPDLENIRPYVEREFNLYGIPYVLRDGLPYTRNCGGDIFVKIKDCLDSQFSPDSVRNLLLDGFIPWKNSEMNLNLIQAGVNLRIICAVSDEKDSGFDIWENSLENSQGYSKELEYYKKLKSTVLLFGQAKSFRDLKNAWKNFVVEFVDDKSFKNPEFELTDKILGRIITELTESMMIEEDFKDKFGKDLHLNNYMDFWVNELSQNSYNPDVKKYGVNIFSYRVAACGDFDYQFIINASQKDITVPLKTLSFITDDKKREFFGLNPDSKNDGREIKLSEDGSVAFIQLYNGQYKQTPKKVYWSSSKVNFSGAAITHTGLKELDEEKANGKEKEYCRQFDLLDDLDFVRNVSANDFEKQPFAQWQKDAHDLWMERKAGDNNSQITQAIKDKVKSFTRFVDKNKKEWTKVSASQLNSFFPCPKMWLFQNVMGLEEEVYSPEIAQAFELGTLYHKILEMVLTQWKQNNNGKGQVPIYPEGISEDQLKETVSSNIDKAFNEYIESSKVEGNRTPDLFKSMLAIKIIQSQKNLMVQNLTDFLKNFCQKAENPDDLKGNMGGLFILALEQEIVLFENDVRYKGAIDCILCTGTDNDKNFKNVILIDYKSGHLPTPSETTIDDIKKLNNAQMAVYVKLVESTQTDFYRNVGQCKVAGGVFYSIKKTSGGFENNWTFPAARGCKNREEYDSTILVLDEYVEEFKKRTDVEQGLDLNNSSTFEDKTYVNRYTDCAECRFKTICRTTFTIGQRD